MFINNSNETHWMHVSDLMSGLMIIFLLISLCYGANQQQIVRDYDDSKTKLYNALMAEFQGDLKKWGADIDRKTLSITFNNPETLFADGEAAISPKFKEILNDFFPKYIEILFRDEFKKRIQEIRIEGHTSSKWVGASPDNAYFLNMALSQDRTRAVLEYCYNLPKLHEHPDQQAFIKDSVTANGLSSSKLKRTPEGKEDEEHSRRVEFRTITDAEKIIDSINAFSIFKK